MRNWMVLKALRQAAKYFFSRDVPGSLKLIPLAAVGYLLFPIDLITDLIPIIGLVDDVAVFAAAIAIFNRLAERHVPALPSRRIYRS